RSGPAAGPAPPAGARAAPGLGPWVMLGKTFKGLTDRTLVWQTAELLARETGRDARTVLVRPELVVEVAFDGLRRSPRHPAGLALRFARVVRYRPDKSAAEADTVASVRELATAEGPVRPSARPGPPTRPAKYRGLKRIAPQWGFTHRGRISHSRSGHRTPP
ncbi:hypothetical protein ACFV6I_28660, partial [Kitasatospora sp. NPDC059803]